MKRIDHANNEFVRRMVAMYFAGGFPFEPHLSSIASDLADLRTMRNASAHFLDLAKGTGGSGSAYLFDAEARDRLAPVAHSN